MFYPYSANDIRSPRGNLTLIWKSIKYTEIQEFRCFFRSYSDEEASKIAEISIIDAYSADSLWKKASKIAENSKIDAHSADPLWKKASKAAENSKIDAHSADPLWKKASKTVKNAK